MHRPKETTCMDYKGECILTENKSKLRSVKKGGLTPGIFCAPYIKN